MVSSRLFTTVITAATVLAAGFFDMAQGQSIPQQVEIDDEWELGSDDGVPGDGLKNENCNPGVASCDTSTDDSRQETDSPTSPPPPSPSPTVLDTMIATGSSSSGGSSSTTPAPTPENTIIATIPAIGGGGGNDNSTTTAPTSYPTGVATDSDSSNDGTIICTDSPLGWYDSDGKAYDCYWYATNDYCAMYGHMYKNHNKTANDVCCACGGGTNSTAR